jgi:putative ABC transport system ATP-binding protein
VVAGLSGVSKVYSGGAEDIHALCGIDLAFEVGELVAVLGPSGSGKTTLLHILGLLDRPTSGNLVFLGEDAMSMKERRKALLRSREIGFVFQSFHLLPRLSARANVMLPLLYAGYKRREAHDQALRALDLVGLSRRAEHLPAELSGGESQRTAIARAMVSGPSLVLADEPTGNLDKKTGGAILDLFSDLNRSKGTTMIIVSHDPDVAARCGRRVSIDDGRITSDERS